ncbi:hypothetical protein AG1IA_04720 [Rhizoctonia solani AG-1 IA]|uniref:Uncharacterized protein n=1 Tax=Thanatephorus cucumeris (strain AG1-IA) TaxID=983506 RepID=L8WTE9_THACA|nr:hypothetical protein AG1IA_04720 [Rhizoctonia solani AG-1 IA]
MKKRESATIVSYDYSGEVPYGPGALGSYRNNSHSVVLFTRHPPSEEIQIRSFSHKINA